MLQQQKCLGQAILPTSNPSTNSGRLSHHMVSQGLVSDVSGINPKHLDASRHIFSSQCIQNRHQSLRTMQTFFFFKRIFNLPINPPTQADRPSRLVARAVRSEAIEDRDSLKT